VTEDTDTAIRKTALITGAAQRIGAEIARVLHEDGMDLLLHYRTSGSAAEALKGELEGRRADSVRLVRADLLDTAELPGLIGEAAAWRGRLDLLINNASSFYPTPMSDATELQWEELMGGNLKAPFFLAQAAAPLLRSSGGGHHQSGGHPFGAPAEILSHLLHGQSGECHDGEIPGAGTGTGDQGQRRSPRGNPLARGGSVGRCPDEHPDPRPPGAPRHPPGHRPHRAVPGQKCRLHYRPDHSRGRRTIRSAIGTAPTGPDQSPRENSTYPFSLWEKVTTAGMQEVERSRKPEPRMRGLKSTSYHPVGSLTPTLSQGERELLQQPPKGEGVSAQTLIEIQFHWIQKLFRFVEGGPKLAIG